MCLHGRSKAKKLCELCAGAFKRSNMLWTAPVHPTCNLTARKILHQPSRCVCIVVFVLQHVAELYSCCSGKAQTRFASSDRFIHMYVSRYRCSKCHHHTVSCSTIDDLRTTFYLRILGEQLNMAGDSCSRQPGLLFIAVSIMAARPRCSCKPLKHACTQLTPRKTMVFRSIKLWMPGCRV